MKLLSIIPLAALGTAFILPDPEVMSKIDIEQYNPIKEVFEKLPSPSEAWDDLEQSVVETYGCARHQLTDAVDYSWGKATEFGKSFEEAFDHQAWLKSAEEGIDDFDKPPRRPKHPHKPPPRRPHRPHHPHKSNQTVYELIAGSKYTTTFTKLINDYPDLVELLNGTTANFTVFVPTDKAFKKIPKFAPKPSKEDLKKILSYHVSPELFPVGRVVVTRTIPTLFNSTALGNAPQRLSTQAGLGGLTINFYSHIIAVNIFGTNGVIHGVDSILVPPPKAIDILRFLPTEFSTLDLGLFQTGLAKALNDSSTHVGGTLFAPTNAAFQKLGPRINAFLFSRIGEKYLAALLKYHIVPNYTLYSDALYKGEEEQDHGKDTESKDGHQIPKGRYHTDLPTLLDEKSLSIDIARFGRFVDISINAYDHISTLDGIASDGVIQVVPRVLIPPKKPGAVSRGEDVDPANLTVEEFKERLEPYVHDEYNDEEEDDQEYTIMEEEEVAWSTEL